MVNRKKHTRKKGSTVFNIVIILLFLIGSSVLLYPTASNMWNNYRDRQLQTSYIENVNNLDKEEYEKMLAKAKEYNYHHRVNMIVDAFDEENEYKLSHPYNTFLNPNGDEIMGYLEIPKIDVALVIYHGIAERTLEKGIGHIEGTSLPVGGEDTHAVLAGHRGLPGAKLFTDIEKLRIGDLFYVGVLHEKMQYKVDQIEIVLPSEADKLKIEAKRDYVTLLTCTPYGINTHRLLVRGERTEWEEVQVSEEGRNPLQNMELRLLLAGIMVILIMLSLLFVSKKTKTRKKRQSNN